MRYIICGADLADMQHLSEFKKILVLIACFFVFFSVRVFLHRHWRFTGQQGREGTNVYSTLPLPPAHEHLIATLYVRWLSRFLNRNACVYQTATRWDLTPYWITIWLIDWLIDNAMFICLIDELILGFCYSDFDIGNWRIRTRIDYNPCITSEPINWHIMQIWLVLKISVLKSSWEPCWTAG